MATVGNEVVTNVLCRVCLDLFSVKKRASNKQPVLFLEAKFKVKAYLCFLSLNPYVLKWIMSNQIDTVRHCDLVPLRFITSFAKLESAFLIAKCKASVS